MTAVAAARTGTVSVIVPGVQTTLRDLPGRAGMWDVGVPPSGAWDELSFALANRAVGNSPGAAGLEAVLVGPALRFDRRALVCVTGAAAHAGLDGRALAEVDEPTNRHSDEIATFRARRQAAFDAERARWATS